MMLRMTTHYCSSIPLGARASRPPAAMPRRLSPHLDPSPWERGRRARPQRCRDASSRTSIHPPGSAGVAPARSDAATPPAAPLSWERGRPARTRQCRDASIRSRTSIHPPGSAGVAPARGDTATPPAAPRSIPLGARASRPPAAMPRRLQPHLNPSPWERGRRARTQRYRDASSRTSIHPLGSAGVAPARSDAATPPAAPRSIPLGARASRPPAAMPLRLQPHLDPSPWERRRPARPQRCRDASSRTSIHPPGSAGVAPARGDTATPPAAPRSIPLGARASRPHAAIPLRLSPHLDPSPWVRGRPARTQRCRYASSRTSFLGARASRPHAAMPLRLQPHFDPSPWERGRLARTRRYRYASICSRTSIHPIGRHGILPCTMILRVSGKGSPGLNISDLCFLS